MIDQASRLRQIIQNKKMARDDKQKRIITVTSGKGGVGKTNLAVNLGATLAQKGNRVLIIDADFGLANVDVIMGTTSSFDLSSFIRGEKNIDEIINEGPLGVKYISGGSGVIDLINLEGVQLQEFVDKLVELEDIADIILFDTGAGINENILRIVAASTEVILVTTNEPTAIMDAYALTKTIHKMEAAPFMYLVINRANTPVEAQQSLSKFAYVVKHYLGQEMRELGYMLTDNSVKKAVLSQTPFVVMYPKSIVSKNIEDIAQRLLGIQRPQSSSGFRGFLERLTKRR